MDFRKVYNDSTPYQVKSTKGVHSILGFSAVKGKDNKKENENGPDGSKKRKVKDFFKTLAKATETSNQQFEEQGVPYRFCVYQQGTSVLIDFVTLDKNNKVKQTLTRDITNEDFDLWIDNIVNGEGLNIDKTG